MAEIDKYAIAKGALVARRNIHALASELAATSAPIPFNHLSRRLDAMRESDLAGIQPLLSIGTATQVNSTIGVFFAALPANPYTAFQAIATALQALYVAYDAIFDTLKPIEHTPAGGHTYATIPLNQLSSLVDELSAVTTATAAFE